jgi:hypothetical protein
MQKERAMSETRPSLRHRWYDDGWDWAVVSFFVLVLLAGIAVWGSAGSPHTASVPDDATTGQGTRPALPAQ